jgi:hypothetical protein
VKVFIRRLRRLGQIFVSREGAQVFIRRLRRFSQIRVLPPPDPTDLSAGYADPPDPPDPSADSPDLTDLTDHAAGFLSADCADWRRFLLK